MTDDPERADGLTLPREIERKYLLSALPERAKAGRRIAMSQGYLPGTAIHERVRSEDDGTRPVLRRTIKLGRGVERIEVEEEIDRSLFEGLYALTVGKRVEKTRYEVKDADATWEIDAFEDRDLVLAEIELESAETAVRFPDWLAPFVVREVTDDPAYLNLNLAR